jgi:hypothetical protein
MAKLPAINQIKKEDFPDQGWIEKLLSPINSFMRSVYQALNKGITVGDNLSGQSKTIDFVYSASGSVSFAWNSPSRPEHVWVTGVVSYGAQPTAAVWANWTFDGTAVTLNQITGLTAGERYKLTVIALTA